MEAVLRGVAGAHHLPCAAREAAVRHVVRGAAKTPDGASTVVRAVLSLLPAADGAGADAAGARVVVGALRALAAAAPAAAADAMGTTPFWTAVTDIRPGVTKQAEVALAARLMAADAALSARAAAARDNGAVLACLLAALAPHRHVLLLRARGSVVPALAELLCDRPILWPTDEDSMAAAAVQLLCNADAAPPTRADADADADDAGAAAAGAARPQALCPAARPSADALAVMKLLRCVWGAPRGRAEADARARERMLASLRALFVHLSNADAPEPSVSLSFLLAELPASMMRLACQFLATQSRSFPSHFMATCVSRMLRWPQTARIGPWVVGVVRALCASRKFEAVAVGTKRSCAHLAAQVAFPAEYPRAWSLVRILLVGHPCAPSGPLSPPPWAALVAQLATGARALLRCGDGADQSQLLQVVVILRALLLQVPECRAHEPLCRAADDIESAIVAALHDRPLTAGVQGQVARKRARDDAGDVPASEVTTEATTQEATAGAGADHADAAGAPRVLPRLLPSAFLYSACRRSVWSVPPALPGDAAIFDPAFGGDLDVTSKSPEFPIAVGLNNVGNSCYMSGVLQCLFATVPFREMLLSPHAEAPTDAQPVLFALRRVFAQMALSLRPALDPAPLKKALPEPFRGFGQQDASEFARTMMHELEVQQQRQVGGASRAATTTSSSSSSNSSNSSSGSGSGHGAAELHLGKRIASIFGGTSSARLECLHCGHVSLRDESFTDIAVSLASSCAGHDDDAALDVQDLLRRQLSPEVLEGASAYRCSSCGTLSRAVRTVGVTAAPSHLVVSLNRFLYDAAAQRQRKLLNPVLYPRRLPLRLASPAFAAAGTTGAASESEREAGALRAAAAATEGDVAHYELYAVTLHIGRSVEHGHYIAVARLLPARSSEGEPDSAEGSLFEALRQRARAGSSARDSGAAAAAGDDVDGWFKMDDASVSLASEAEVRGPRRGDGAKAHTAYMLFYRRVEGAGEGRGDDGQRGAAIAASLLRWVGADNAKWLQQVAARDAQQTGGAQSARRPPPPPPGASGPRGCFDGDGPGGTGFGGGFGGAGGGGPIC